MSIEMDATDAKLSTTAMTTASTTRMWCNSLAVCGVGDGVIDGKL